MKSFNSLLKEVLSCTICSPHLPHGVRPVLQIQPQARILIVGQAPGRKVHESGVPFLDASGDRLRDWMGVTSEVFYDAGRVAILPMSFCFPGSRMSGDLPPRPECAPAWRSKLFGHLQHLELTILIGKYAQAYHLNSRETLTKTVGSWQKVWPGVVPLPHPSPRNNIWLHRNPWFEEEVIPQLQRRVREVLAIGEVVF